MTVIQNNPGSGDRGNGGSGFLLGAVLLIAFLIIFFVFGLPTIRGNRGGDGTNLNIPGRINVDVNPGGGDNSGGNGGNNGGR